jgi:two-component system, NarL family, sensor kinase
MRHFTFTCSFWFLFGMAMAQNLDTASINALNKRAFALQETAGDSALKICFAVLQQSREAGYLKGQGDACVTIGAVYQLKGNFQKSDSFFNAALQLRRQIGDSARVAAVLINLGINQSLQTQYSAAIEKTLQAVETLENSQQIDHDLLGGAYHELSIIFDEYLEPDEALRYAQKSLQTYIKTNDNELIGQAAYSVGNRFHKNLLPDSALFYYNLAYNNFITSTNDPDYLANILTNKGIVYTEKGDFPLAKDHFEQAETMLRQLGEDADYFHLYLNKADWYIQQGKLQQGLDYLKNAQSVGTWSDYDKNYLFERLAKAYALLNRHDSAYHYQQLAYTVRDSIYNESKRKAFVKFQAERYKNELAQQAAITQQKNARVRQLFITAAALAFIAILLVFAYVQRRKAFRLISKQQETLHRQAVDELIKSSELKFLNASIEGGESARNNISKEIHDRLGSAMVTLSWQYDAVLEDIPANAPQRQQMIKLNAALKGLYHDIRHIAHQLGSGVLERVGLVPVLEELCQDIADGKKLSVDFSCYGMETRLNFFQEINILRIIQELVSNTLKYADASQLSVQINRIGNDLNIMVEDNGRGFDPANTHNRGIGMQNVEDRIRALNGTIQVESQPTTGTSVILNIPIQTFENPIQHDEQAH